MTDKTPGLLPHLAAKIAAVFLAATLASLGYPWPLAFAIPISFVVSFRLGQLGAEVAFLGQPAFPVLSRPAGCLYLAAGLAVGLAALAILLGVPGMS